MDESTNTDDIAAAWVSREDRGPLEADARTARDAWLAADPRHRGAYLRARAVFLRAGRASALGHGFGHELALRNGSPARRHGRRWLQLVATVAMLAVVAIGLRPLFTDPGKVDYSTDLGELLRVPLPDGSVMTLNSDSRVALRYNESERRVVLLRGEMLVTVTKNPLRPFLIESGDVDVVAVGTSFSVRKGEAGDLVVLVNEGIVDIRPDKSQFEPLRVHANHEAVASRDRGVSVRPLVEEAVHRRLAWREGLIFFEGATLADAAMEFSRYSDRMILIDDQRVAERRVVGVFSSSDPEGFAKAVADSLGLEVENRPEGVYLRRSN